MVVVCRPGVASHGVSYHKAKVGSTFPFADKIFYDVSLKNNFYIVFALLQSLFFWLLTSF